MQAHLDQYLESHSLYHPELLAAAARLYPNPMFSPQRQALAETGVIEGESRLVIAPTGSGKSMIADAAVLMTLARKQPVLYLVSTRSLARERAAQLARALSPAGYRVAATSRDDRTADEDIQMGRVDVVVAVYEKARILSLRSPGMISQYGLIVADEFQTLADPDRGRSIEVALSSWISAENPPQLVALSAVEKRLGPIAARLGLPIWQTMERAIPILHGEIDLEAARAEWIDEAGSLAHLELASPPGEPAARLAAVLEMLPGPVLYFAATRREALDLAWLMADKRHRNGPTEIAIESDFLVSFLLSVRIGLHTTDLTRRQRADVEHAIASGDVDICIATTTLAEGLNTGVRSVVIAPGVMSYAGDCVENLLGRAGRPGAGTGYGFFIKQNGAAPERFAKYSNLKEQDEALQCAAWLCAMGDTPTAAHIYECLIPLFPHGSVENALQRGRDLGVWEETEEGQLRARPETALIAGGGVEAETLASWRTILRRFAPSMYTGTTAFLALGGSRIAASLTLDQDERLSGRWVEELRVRLREDPSPLARYFLNFLENGYTLSRRIQQSAKAAMLFLRASESADLDEIGGEFQITPGQIEEFLHAAGHLLATAEEFGRLAGSDVSAFPRVICLQDTGQRGPAKIRDTEPTAEEVSVEPRLVIRRGTTGLIRFEGREVRLTRLQFRLLELLARHAGNGVPYERVEDYVWSDAKVERQQISFHRKNLEERLAAAAGRPVSIIETHASWGLRLNMERTEIRFEEMPADFACLESPARVIAINSVARAVCL